MFDVGASELLVIGAVALIVIGPKDLPGLLRGLGEATTKIRRMASEFRGQFDDAMREAELDQAKKAFTDVTDAANSVRTTFNPLDTIRNELTSVRDSVSAATSTSATDTGTTSNLASEVAPVIDLPPPPEPLPVSLEPPAMAVEPEPEAQPEPAPKKRRKKAGDEA